MKLGTKTIFTKQQSCNMLLPNKSAVKKRTKIFATLEKQLEQEFPAPLARAIQLFNLLNLE